MSTAYVCLLEADFYILRHTTAPAVLTENFFMDSHPDCAFLLSPEGQQSLVDLHVDGIISHLDSL
ncbi:MAG: N-acetylmuramoyl-L-alanine amidase [Bacteroidales bacterium]|nr:N-acetylmuramoyl-L-alanine amidase [Bacteroidales bacterium]